MYSSDAAIKLKVELFIIKFKCDNAQCVRAAIVTKLSSCRIYDLFI